MKYVVMVRHVAGGETTCLVEADSMPDALNGAAACHLETAVEVCVRKIDRPCCADPAPEQLNLFKEVQESVQPAVEAMKDFGNKILEAMKREIEKLQVKK